jgi:hypothetical protein
MWVVRVALFPLPQIQANPQTFKLANRQPQSAFLKHRLQVQHLLRQRAEELRLLTVMRSYLLIQRLQQLPAELQRTAARLAARPAVVRRLMAAQRVAVHPLQLQSCLKLP